MNINWIEHEYGHLKLIENDINYQFEPPFTRKVKSQKRNINFGDLKEDFIDELATFGFSPFIHRSYASQNHDKNITKYKKKKFNYGLYNYVKKKYGKNVINHNLNRHNKFENKKIDGHYLYQTLYQIDVLKSYDEEDDNEIIKKAEKKQLDAKTRNFSEQNIYDTKMNALPLPKANSSKSNNHKISNQLTSLQSLSQLSRAFSDDKFNFSPQKKLTKNHSQLTFRKRKNYHPILSIKSSNGVEQKTEGINSTLFSEYNSPKLRKKTEVINYPALSKVSLQSSKSTSKFASRLPNSKINSIKETLGNKKNKLTLLNEIENSPNGIFKKAKKIKNKYIK